MRKIVCHLGMRKTASTSIQAWLCKIEGVEYIGKFENKGKFESDLIGWELENLLSHSSSLYSEELGVDGLSNKCRAGALSHSRPDGNGLLSYVDDDSGAPLVLSSESFLGPMPFPHCPRVNLLRLSRVVGSDALVMVFLREQFAFLKSQYGIMVRHGYPGTYQAYIQQIVAHAHTGTLPTLSYLNLYGVIKEVFPNAVIMPVEQFLAERAARKSVKDAINEDSHLPEVPRLNQGDFSALGALRFVNKNIFNYMLGKADEAAFGDLEWSVMSRNLRSFGSELGLSDFGRTRRRAHKAARVLRPFFSEPSYTSSYDKNLASLFSSNNRALQDRTGMPLAEYGYVT